MITINGKTYKGNSVSIRNGKMTIDGIDIVGGDAPSMAGVMLIKVEGEVALIQSDLSVSCGNVAGSVTAGGSVNCDEVGGNVTATGSVNCDDIGGDVRAGGSVNADKIKGDVSAGGSVRRG